jgi:hypothetical protein
MADDATRSADVLAKDLVAKVKTDETFRAGLAADTDAAVDQVKSLADQAIAKVDQEGAGSARKLEAQAVSTAASADKFVYIVAVMALGLVSIGVVSAIFALAWPQITPLMASAIGAAGGDIQKLAGIRVAFSIPDGLIALGSAAIGALAGLLGPLGQRSR